MKNTIVSDARLRSDHEEEMGDYLTERTQDAVAVVEESVKVGDAGEQRNEFRSGFVGLFNG
jgi:hypothetical protein